MCVFFWCVICIINTYAAMLMKLFPSCTEGELKRLLVFNDMMSYVTDVLLECLRAQCVRGCKCVDVCISVYISVYMCVRVYVCVLV